MSPTNSEIAALDGEGRIPAYVARPDADTTRAIIVIPEIFGVNEGIRKKADDWAALLEDWLLACVVPSPRPEDAAPMAWMACSYACR